VLLAYILESCVGRVNPRRLQVPAFAGQVWEPAQLCVRVELAVGQVVLGAGQARVEKFFVRVTEC